jgi:hypothetical protein
MLTLDNGGEMPVGRLLIAERAAKCAESRILLAGTGPGAGLPGARMGHGYNA